MISINQVKKILNTLPIGYYIKKDVPVELSETSDSSYCDVMNEKIVISYSQIKSVLDKLSPEDPEVENNIRCILYHEVSHAFLTPTTLEADYASNVFEDERIETLLKSYYKRVDFKKFVKEINNYHGEPPKNGNEAFYQTVRYRVGKKEFVDRVDKIINKYKDISKISKPIVVNDYYLDILNLYNDITKDFKELSKKDKIKQEYSIGNLNLPGEGENQEKEEQSSAPQIDLSSIAKSVLNDYYNKNIDDKLNFIFSNIKSHKTQNGSAINSYSGVFNPRSVMRDDYKYFVQKNRLGKVRAYSKFHLNLFIDVSGSFYFSEKIVNQMLFSLTKFEKSEPSFSFDLVTMWIGEELKPKNDRKIKCGGGNYLDKEIFDIYNKLQYNDCQNYNIVLFDGDALSDSYNIRRDLMNFKAFDHKNTAIISDDENEGYINRAGCTQCKTIFINNHYADKLIDQVMQTLNLLIR